MAITWPWTRKKTSSILWLDLGDLGDLVNPDGPHEQWQDHGLGLLRTILHQNGIQTDLASTRAVTSWEQLARQIKGYDMLLMNVRSYTFPVAYNRRNSSRNSTRTAWSSPAGCTPPSPWTRWRPSPNSTRSARGRAKMSSSTWSATRTPSRV